MTTQKKEGEGALYFGKKKRKGKTSKEKPQRGLNPPGEKRGEKLIFSIF